MDGIVQKSDRNRPILDVSNLDMIVRVALRQPSGFLFLHLVFWGFEKVLCNKNLKPQFKFMPFGKMLYTGFKIMVVMANSYVSTPD